MWEKCRSMCAWYIISTLEMCLLDSDVCQFVWLWMKIWTYNVVWVQLWKRRVLCKQLCTSTWSKSTKPSCDVMISLRVTYAYSYARLPSKSFTSQNCLRGATWTNNRGGKHNSINTAILSLQTTMCAYFLTKTWFSSKKTHTNRRKKPKSLQHPVFPGGHPSKY